MFNGCHSLNPTRQTNSVKFRKMMSATTKLEDHSLLDIHIITQYILNYPPYAHWKFCIG